MCTIQMGFNSYYQLESRTKFLLNHNQKFFTYHTNDVNCFCFSPGPSRPPHPPHISSFCLPSNMDHIADHQSPMFLFLAASSFVSFLLPVSLSQPRRIEPAASSNARGHEPWPIKQKRSPWRFYCGFK